MSELLPCPFCGGQMKMSDGVFQHAEQGDCILSIMGWSDHKLAAWNTRAPVRVKPLVWEAEDGRQTCLGADGCGKLYRVLVRHDGSAVLRPNASQAYVTRHASEADAKAAAQADYEARILACIMGASE